MRHGARIPEPQQNLREAAARAFESLAGVELEELARRSGAKALEGRVAIALEVLSRSLVVELDSRRVLDPSGAEVPDSIAAPVARYLALSAKLDGLARACGPDEIGFADDPSARGYLGPFRGRVVAPLLARFGHDPEAFSRAAAALGGERAHELEASGALAWRLHVFPRARLAFILHPGDDELEPECQVLFPRAVFRAFAVDDAVAMAELASRALRGRLWPPRHR